MLTRTALLLALTSLAACSTSADAPPVVDPGARDASSDAAYSDARDASSDAAYADARAADARDPTDAGAGPCTLEEASTLPGVTLHVTSTRCTFTLAEAAAGIEIPYAIVADADVPVVTGFDPMESPGAAPGPSGLHVFEILSGSGQQYCRCDTGLAMARDAGAASAVTKGTHALAFVWDGKNWDGPSDYGQPEGAAFPAGTYRLELRARGSFSGDAGTDQPFVVRAAFQVTLTP